MSQVNIHEPTGPLPDPHAGPPAGLLAGLPADLPTGLSDEALDATHDLHPWQHLLAAVRDTFPHAMEKPNPSLALNRVLAEACAHLNLPARPTPVFLDITRGSGPDAPREGGIDERAILVSPTGWAGHLVTLADLGAGHTVLLDPAADRFDRPIRNLITGGPLVAPTAQSHHQQPNQPTMQPSRTLTTLRPLPGNDTTLTYRAIPTTHTGRDAWRTTGWWYRDNPSSVRDAATAVADALHDTFTRTFRNASTRGSTRHGASHTTPRITGAA